MIDRRLNGKDEIPIVIEVNHNQFTIGIAGEDSPLKSFSPKGNKKVNSLAQLYEFVLEEDWGVNLTDRPFFVVEPTNIHPRNRKELAEFFFTKFSIPLIAFQDKAQSIFYSTGRHTALIVEINENEVIATPMEGVRRYSKASIIKDIEGGPESNIHIISKIINESIMKCPKDTWPRFMENIFLYGEHADQPDLDVMISEELKSLISEALNKYMHVIQLKDKPYFGWIGGSMIVSMRLFNKWLTKEEYFQGKYYEKYLKLIIKGEIMDFIYDDKL